MGDLGIFVVPGLVAFSSVALLAAMTTRGGNTFFFIASIPLTIAILTFSVLAYPATIQIISCLLPTSVSVCFVLLLFLFTKTFGENVLYASMVAVVVLSLFCLEMFEGLTFLRELMTMLLTFFSNNSISLAAYSALLLSTFFIIDSQRKTVFPKSIVDPEPTPAPIQILAEQECTKPVCYPEDLPTSDDKKAFVQVYDMLHDDLLSELPSLFEQPDEAVHWIGNMMSYNVKGGKMNRGLIVVGVMKTLAARDGRELSNDELARACVLGWCVEWLQAFFLVADDVMDDSLTRRGQPCWYRLPEVKMIAINDAFILESAVFRILRRYFGQEEYYIRLVDLFHEVIYKTELGQLLDLTSQPLNGPANFDRFTVERHRLIVKYKTAFYTFYLSTAMGMIVSGVTESTLYSTAQHICCIIGEYFQIQDDVLDCFGDPKVIGKVGTDIQDNKCSWLVVQALSIGSAEDRKLLEENYGKDQSEKIEKVKALYKKLGLKEKFDAYEEQSYKDINLLLDSVKELPREIFELLLKQIYKRNY